MLIEIWDRVVERIEDRLWARLYAPTIKRMRNRKVEVLHHVE